MRGTISNPALPVGRGSVFICAHLALNLWWCVAPEPARFLGGRERTGLPNERAARNVKMGA